MRYIIDTFLLLSLSLSFDALQFIDLQILVNPNVFFAIAVYKKYKLAIAFYSTMHYRLNNVFLYDSQSNGDNG